MIKMKGFKQLCVLAFLLIYIFSFGINAKRSFIVTAPKLLDVGTTEKIQVTLFDIESKGVVKIRLLNTTEDSTEVAVGVYNEVTAEFENGGSRSVDLPIPSDISTEYTNAVLQVICTFPDYNVNKSIVLGLRHNRQLLFVSTDKPFYKPGQTVKFRTLLVDNDLKPPKQSTLGHIFISDPNKIRVAQWKNLSFDAGLIQKEFPLPEEPVLGTWSIHVASGKAYEIRNFAVKEYVLPTFEVTITPPSYILRSVQNITWKICAKYTYGKPVQGVLVTRVKPTTVFWNKETPTIRNKDEIDGCRNVTAFVGELSDLGFYGHHGFEITAEVVEDGTGANISSSDTIYPTTYPFTITRRDTDAVFRPGLPFPTKIEVKKPDSKPMPDELIKVCIISRIEKWAEDRFITDTISSCKNYTTDERGEFVFTIPPQHPNTIYIDVEVKPVYFPSDLSDSYSYKPSLSFQMKPWYSADGRHFQMQPIPSKLECGKTTSILVHYTTNEPGTKQVYYQVISKGGIVRDGILSYTFNPEDDLTNFVDDTYLMDGSRKACNGDEERWDNEIGHPKYIGKFELMLNIASDMVPKAKVIIYSVTDEGNVVADSISLEIKPCFANQVNLKFGEEKQTPGSEATIQLTAAPKSLCSVGITDKSVFILDKGDRLTGSKVYNALGNQDTGEYTPPHQPTGAYEYCSKKGHEDEKPSRTKRHHLESVGYLDAITAFSKAGIIVLSDLELETRLCKPVKYGSRNRCFYPTQHVYYATTAVPVALAFSSNTAQAPEIGDVVLHDYELRTQTISEQPTTTVRTFFPETWLWDLHIIGDDGELSLKQNIPDSITEWQGDAVCVHPDAGLGISDTASVTAFQPFFASITLPYSVIRGETVPVIVTIFNYLKECLPLKVHLDQTEDFRISANDTLTKPVCVCSEKSITTRFSIKPTTLGQVNLTVTAATSKDENVCSNLGTADITRSDSITKSLLVEAEGFLKEETKNIFFCMEDIKDDVYKTEHDILLSENIVEGSSRAYVSITGDLMGPTLEGLENLVQLPTGCGEQNMVRLVPNIVVLDYLEATNRLTETIKQKARRHIREGYTRQQKFRHADGSYSAFGKYDPEGSMFLTAFVVRSFASARRHIDIDTAQLEFSRKWILSRQQENGCFPVIGTVHNKALKGGIGKDDKTPSTLTAYVLLSLLEYGDLNKTVVDKALRCIEAQNNPSDYSLALFAYAATLAGSSSAADYLQKLNEKQATEGGYKFWKNSDKSIAVETAAYAILTILKNGGSLTENLQKAGEIARWLTQQRNSYGGFVSTQDTVLALQALGGYAALITRKQLDMGVSIKGNDLDEIFQLDESNELLTQRVRLPTLPTSIEVEANGKGCALVQSVLRYNVPVPESSSDFVLSIESERNQNNCKTPKILICASYEAQNDSNMVVLELKMVSGFIPSQDSVKKLLRMPDLELRRYEIKENAVNFYFVKLTGEGVCFSFDVIQEVVVDDRKPANAKIYDYYDQDKTLSVAYSIDETCENTLD